MATQVQFRGGTTSEHSTFTGVAREVTVDTTKKTVVVHDGSTAGGIPLAKESAATSAVAITGGTINGTTIGATTASTGAFTTLSATGVATFSAGTVSLPAITTTGDTNTGFWFPAADTIATSTGGSERLRINSTGNVGIGTTSPSQALHVAYGNNGYILSQQSNTLASTLRANLALVNGSTTFGASDRTYRFSNLGTSATASDLVFDYWNGTAFTERMRIDSAGSVLIGTTSASIFKFNVVGGAIFSGWVSAGTATANSIAIGNFTSVNRIVTYGADTATKGQFSIVGATTDSSSSAEYLRIDTSGNLGLGVTPSAWGGLSPSIQLAYGSVYSAAFSVMGMSAASYFNGGWKYYSTGQAPALYQMSQGSHAWSTAASGTAGNAITFTQAMTLDASGQLLIGKTSATANGGDLQVSSGITFPATQVAKSDANTLDDYEEGTWTPVLNGFTIVGATTVSGQYTKIGGIVFLRCSISAATSIASVATTSNITGLPFSSNVQQNVPLPITDTSLGSVTYATGLCRTDGKFYTPTWSATGQTISMSTIFNF